MSNVTIGTRLRCTQSNGYFKIGDELVIDKLELLGYEDTHSGVLDEDEDGISYTLIKRGDNFLHFVYRNDWAVFKKVDTPDDNADD